LGEGGDGYCAEENDNKKREQKIFHFIKRLYIYNLDNKEFSNKERSFYSKILIIS
jgi:hypothetical protein